ncbi:hypothetical protein AVEN_225567-1 [Araneus ventricosus]|uniref:Reverse transcriptase RNase H-like domain-containing protein n=1 Tax=Araneus ventricosus TaxID=182803 RepID=A0A4Y2P8Q1_ARAVE|nr:hypothetical protein AVEN_225567-1 [Araneus ventricosus]
MDRSHFVSVQMLAVMLLGPSLPKEKVQRSTLLSMPVVCSSQQNEITPLLNVNTCSSLGSGEFRGYVENQEIIASDHQPLKCLISIKSPSGRLARWALQIQSFNPKIECTPGKANDLADMLSRPTNLNEDVSCDIFAVSADFLVRKSRHSTRTVERRRTKKR